jgi:hypothetical protein
MGFPTKVQLINRKDSEQWYINFPSALAQAMEFEKGEVMFWIIEDKETLILVRPDAPPRHLKKKPKKTSSEPSSTSGNKPATPSATTGAGNARED